MSNDSFTTTTSRSWFSRMGSALSGILFGLFLFVGSFLLLAWNEGRAIHRAKTLEVGAGQVISLSADTPVADNEGKLVHLSGNAEAGGPVRDKTFGITAEALKLRRDVEMYQWKQEEKSETKQKLGGGEETVTTYSYSKTWSSTLLDSTQFHAPDGHTNPEAMPVESTTFVAPDIHVGGFDLPESLTDLINNYEPRPATAEEADKAARRHEEDIHTTPTGQLYIGANPSQPEIGDLRVTFQTAPAGPVSIIAGQFRNTFEPFNVPKLGTIELLQCGTMSASAMFQKEQETNAMLTWLLRLAGFVCMLFGLLLITNVLSVAASIIPFLGDLVGTGTGMLAFAVALPLTLVTIALSWLAYRPLVGIPLFLLAAGSVVFAVGKLAKARKKA